MKIRIIKKLHFYSEVFLFYFFPDENNFIKTGAVVIITMNKIIISKCCFRSIPNWSIKILSK